MQDYHSSKNDSELLEYLAQLNMNNFTGEITDSTTPPHNPDRKEESDYEVAEKRRLRQEHQQ